MNSPAEIDLRALAGKPFDLLQAIERRCLELVQVLSLIHI